MPMCCAINESTVETSFILSFGITSAHDGARHGSHPWYKVMACSCTGGGNAAVPVVKCFSEGALIVAGIGEVLATTSSRGRRPIRHARGGLPFLSLLISVY